jgi:hypothetical protein
VSALLRLVHDLGRGTVVFRVEGIVRSGLWALGAVRRTTVSQTVIVGFDDTDHGTYAVTCAIREAAPRSAPLRLIHA